MFIPSLSWQKDCILCIKAFSAPQAAQKTCCGSAKGSRPAERCLSFSSFPTLVPSLSWQMFSLKYKMRQEAVCDPHPERCLDRGSRERRRSGGGCLQKHSPHLNEVRPIFVPSLSWQTDRFHTQKAGQKWAQKGNGFLSFLSSSYRKGQGRSEDSQAHPCLQPQ